MNQGHPRTSQSCFYHPHVRNEKKSGYDLFLREVAFILNYARWFAVHLRWRTVSFIKRALPGINANQDQKLLYGRDAQIPLKKIAPFGVLYISQ